jgi:hypothetical protein
MMANPDISAWGVNGYVGKQIFAGCYLAFTSYHGIFRASRRSGQA